MYLTNESIGTVDDMANRLSVHEDVLRAYLGVDDDDKEQYYICALQSPSPDLPYGTSPCIDSALSCETAVTESHRDDEQALIQKLEASSGWFQMEDVNYVPPPNIASRKESPIHRDSIFNVGEVSLP